jgi:hypothetical protein
MKGIEGLFADRRNEGDRANFFSLLGVFFMCLASFSLFFFFYFLNFFAHLS